LNAGGCLAPVLWVAAILYAGSLRPDYSHSRQYVSELAARGTPTQHVMQVTGFVAPGLLIAGFGFLLGITGRTKLVAVAASFLIVGGIAKAVAGVFLLGPCCRSGPPSVEEGIHNLVGAVHYFTLGMAALTWSVAAPQTFGRRRVWFRWYSLVSLVLAVAAPPLLIGVGVATSGDVGLFQRVSFGILNVWIFVFAALLWRDGPALGWEYEEVSRRSGSVSV